MTALEDLSTFLSSTAEKCVFCGTEQLADEEHLRNKHLKEAVYFSDQGKEKFVVACFCKDASTDSKRSHYHCPFCEYRSAKFNFKYHLQVIHGITAEKNKGSHPAFEDLNTFLSSTAEECVFCGTKQLADEEHLRNKHLKEAVHFSDQGKEKFVVACFCKDASANSKTSHYHCPFCEYRSRNFKLKYHLQVIHGITVEQNKGSHRAFEDLNTFLSCTAEKCVFCWTEQLANEEHLRKKHLKEAVYFSDQGKVKFVVACFCKDASTNSKRSHYHCPFCEYRSLSRNLIFTKHLQLIHGITAEKKKGEKDRSLSVDKNTRDRSPHIKSPAESLFLCPHCDFTFSEADHLSRHQSEAHSLSSTSMKCIDGQNGSKNTAGSHRAFEDLNVFLSCTAEKCVFCRTKQLANEEHLRKKHLKQAVYFSDQGKVKFVVACFCKDASTNSKRSHYHCPFCGYRSLSRNLIFTKHLQLIHGITAEKKKGEKDRSLSVDINTPDRSPHIKSPAESLFLCPHCDSTFSEADHLSRHQSEKHSLSSTSMKCTDGQNGSKNVDGSHRAFEDLNTFLSCTAEKCVFCRTKQLANEEHLRKKHLRQAVYFSDQGKVKFVVACFCKDASTNSKRSHYHCPFCGYRSLSRNFIFTKHLQLIHGITAEKKKGEKDTSLSVDKNTRDRSPHIKSPAESLFLCPHCDSTFSEADHLSRHQSEAHSLSSTSMKCIDGQNGSKNMAGSHRAFEDLDTLLSCTAEKCVFCRTKQLANEQHLRKKHLKEAVYFSDQGKVKFVVACFCKDASTNSKRSHYHCPFCGYRSLSRNLIFTKHLQLIHGITAEKKKGEKDRSLSVDKNTRDRSPLIKSPAESLFLCPHCDSTFSEADHLSRHQSEAHSLSSTSMKCIDGQNGSKNTAGSHRAFEDLNMFLSCTAEKCVFCRTKQLANEEHLRKKHLKEAVYFSDQGKVKFVVACFCEDASTNSKRSHYHCPFCESRSLSRNFNFTKHLKVIHGIAAEKNKGGNYITHSRGENTRDRSPHTKRPALGLFSCPHCDSTFNASNNLRRHQRDVHDLSSVPIICVDRHSGVFVTPRYDHGPLFPIHVIKSTSPPAFGCEIDSCQESMKAGRLSGNPSKECEHLMRTRYVKSYTPPATLTLESLKEMEQKELITKEWREQCELLHGTAVENGVDTVYPILYGDMGYSKRTMFFSVYTDKSDSWCKFGRTRVSFDSASGKWNCQCGEAVKSHGCLHRMLSMWWIFQESPRVLLPDLDALRNALNGLETEIFT